MSWLDSDLGSELANVCAFGNGARFGFKSAEEKVVKVVALVTEVTRSSMKISSFESWPESSLSKGLKLIIPPVDNSSRKEAAAERPLNQILNLYKKFKDYVKNLSIFLSYSFSTVSDNGTFKNYTYLTLAI